MNQKFYSRMMFFYIIPILTFLLAFDVNVEAQVSGAPCNATRWTGGASWNPDGSIDDLESMTKKELELLGREHGVELDRRKTRATLVGQMRDLLSK